MLDDTTKQQVITDNQTLLQNHEPKDVLRWFQHLATIPHGSGEEQDLSNSLKGWAESKGLEVKQDEVWNLLIIKPGQCGLEESSPVILHGHIDMVNVKEDTSKHDFLGGDPLQLRILNDDEVWAFGTSLGADNGVGVSFILSLLESNDLPHPPIEAVLTVQEERGKVGGGLYKTEWLTGKRFIDMNWFREKDILIGTAGDLTVEISADCTWEDVPGDWVASKLSVAGATGGHCEMNIDDQGANTIVLLARLLRACDDSIRICSACGGHQNSAIPTSAEVVFVSRRSDTEQIYSTINRIGETIKSEFGISDPKLQISVEEVQRPQSMSSAADAVRFANIVSALPNGVHSRSLEHPGLIECSSNLGLLWTVDSGVVLLCTITSLVMSRKHDIVDRIKSIEKTTGGGVHVELIWSDAPELESEDHSALLDVAKATYLKSFGREPNVMYTSCSFEFGLFKKRIPGLDVICIGSNMDSLHSDKEHFSLSSMRRVWEYVKLLVASL